MKILLTGSAGFIGSAMCLKLLELGHEVLGIDNHNNYYSPELKEARLSRHIYKSNYIHERVDLAESQKINEIFEKFQPEKVINLAAQAGVRYSMVNPMSYINSNILGFMNILECCKIHNVKHLIFASSSSVYGSNTTTPYSVSQNVDHPLNIYAATKKSNELMAHSYSHLYQIPTTGLRFFTVYGPWDRPDMALQKFAQKIVNGETIEIFNYGLHERDFTYIDDIIEGIALSLNKPPTPNSEYSSDNPDPSTSAIAPWKIYNIGNNNPVKVIDYIKLLEAALGIKAKKKYLPIQPGEVLNTWANVDELIKDFDYHPNTNINEGIANFVKWFKSFYKIK